MRGVFLPDLRPGLSPGIIARALAGHIKKAPIRPGGLALQALKPNRFLRAGPTAPL